MNYEKKYKEALEKLQEAFAQTEDGCKISGLTRGCIENIFPELADSEDERIRKDIISYLRNEKIVKRYISDIEIDKWIAWLEKQGEQKPSYKTEPKFKVGDWIVFNGLVLRINEIVNGYYITESIDGIPCSYDLAIDNIARLWTNQDARVGDVLITYDEFTFDESIFIYSGSTYKYVKCYAGLTIKNERLNIEGGNWTYTRNCVLHPATKEQSELLFSKLKEAGYVWNNEKKELKKIEVINKDIDDEKIRKNIIELVKQSSEILNAQNQKDMLDWLENQHTDPYNDVGFDCGEHCWSMRARDNGVEILFDGELKAFLSLEKSFIYPIYSQPSLIPKYIQEIIDIAKFEPKFNVDDWIVTDDSFGKIVRHVDEIKLIDKKYIVSDENGLIYDISFSNEHKWHKWTFQDAKDGDVLASKDGSTVVIFRRLDSNESFSSYYNTTGHGQLNWARMCFIPATKEQRDILFRKMKEDGWEWDAEKKELKKIEANTPGIDKAIELIENVLNNSGYDVDKFKKDFKL